MVLVKLDWKHWWLKLCKVGEKLSFINQLNFAGLLLKANFVILKQLWIKKAWQKSLKTPLLEFVFSKKRLQRRTSLSVDSATGFSYGS